jgi:hypothetical protein
VEETIKPGQTRKVEEALFFAIGHRIRIEILCLLNEAIYTAAGLAARTPWALPTIRYHLKTMLRSGSIEVAKEEKVRNVTQYFYRAIELPVVSDEEAATLPPEVKQEYAAVILQAIMAESLEALRAQKLSKPQVRMMWSWYNLDEQGRQELADEQRESWERFTEIEGRAANRRAKSGEEGKTMIAVTLGFERGNSADSSAPAMHRLTPGEFESEVKPE